MKLDESKATSPVHRRLRRRAFSVVEAVFVAAIASMLLSSVLYVVSRTTRFYKKSTDLLSVQSFLNLFISRINSDIRGLRSMDSVSDHEIVFTVSRLSRIVTIQYSWNPKLGLISRTESVSPTSFKTKFFESSVAVDQLLFDAVRDAQGRFRHLDMVVRIKAHSPGEGKPTFLTVPCRLVSRCRQTDLTFLGEGILPMPQQNRDTLGAESSKERR
ncbi:MAG TPA: hypothetical protein PLU72_13290 [Candidatus Ozemobacteraceae bacterium]|nr:hypothetical protein [Candidatus Ozemobacteraceae bacterium]